ncbi:hypothetical protein AAL_07471 [Moelleriella libera RCEF 2490]|uniref:Uncharacterized protein n=1 Tax=Moelleriella libera RCEF 2490 TaxID=1081109 RepID=A0A162I8B6_9HYPO|nr:hypothetical protein AAL_07471 [Moelleriella libera RCEF 2490]
MRSFVLSLDLRGPSCESRQYSTLRKFCIRIQTPAGWEDSQDYGYLRIAGLKSNRIPRLVNVPVPTAAIFGTLRRYETFVIRMQTRGDWKETQDYGYPPVAGLKSNHVPTCPKTRQRACVIPAAILGNNAGTPPSP